ncbi:hypothetical protein TIFTF001_010177 [Ficus carica]|uniref:Uncharacterized protein n=1 Tax=Ficus carica TaxID=3494 RepID=A0AA88A893_FICCA|nr:hypothetical protein TIFTF001_010177 [Ficus carica]
MGILRFCPGFTSIRRISPQSESPNLVPFADTSSTLNDTVLFSPLRSSKWTRKVTSKSAVMRSLDAFRTVSETEVGATRSRLGIRLAATNVTTTADKRTSERSVWPSSEVALLAEGLPVVAVVPVATRS